jgi:hypothetical protein
MTVLPAEVATDRRGTPTGSGWRTVPVSFCPAGCVGIGAGYGRRLSRRLVVLEPVSREFGARSWDLASCAEGGSGDSSRALAPQSLTNKNTPAEPARYPKSASRATRLTL